VAVQACGADPSFAIGGNLNESGSNAHAGQGDVFVAEADESDRSFLVLDPFLTTIDPEGFVVLCLDDPGAARLADVPTKARVRTYGTAPEADLRLVDV